MVARALWLPLLAAGCVGGPARDAQTPQTPPTPIVTLADLAWQQVLLPPATNVEDATAGWPVTDSSPARYSECLRFPPGPVTDIACDMRHFTLLVHPKTGVVWVEVHHGLLGTTEWRGPARLKLEPRLPASGD